MTASAQPSVHKQRGFTLVEAVVVMVITGILAGIMVLFIRRPVQNYVDAAGRAELSDVADLALRRISREVRASLPNSVRVLQPSADVRLLEFFPVKSGGTYLAAEDNSGTPVLDFLGAGKSFTVIETMPASPYDIQVGDYIVVYNLGSGYDGADAYADPAAGAPDGGNRAQVASLGPAANVVNLSSNPFSVATARNIVPNTSPTHRFNVASQPVTFRCDTTQQTLTRYWNYGVPPKQVDQATDVSMTTAPVSNTIKSAMLANNIVACDFRIVQLANTHTGLIEISLTMQRPGTTETATLSHQIHVDNTP